MAANPNTSPQNLALLAKDTEWYVRYMVAKNPSASPETLALLVKDEDYDIRELANKSLKSRTS